jgi:Protein of unknown function (DUF3072)
MNLAHDPNYDLVRDPDEWTTGDEPITSAQRKYLASLATKAGEPIPEEDLDLLTKAEASERIDELLG